MTVPLVLSGLGVGPSWLKALGKNKKITKATLPKASLVPWKIDILEIFAKVANR